MQFDHLTLQKDADTVFSNFGFLVNIKKNVYIHFIYSIYTHISTLKLARAKYKNVYGMYIHILSGIH